MPNCGSQIVLCDLPIRIDSYKGCSHLCKYCFTSFKYDNNKIEIKDNIKSLKVFIEGKRTTETIWCDWNIPLHWGGLSDPFQPIEKKLKVSYNYLQILQESKYPFIVSTKGRLIADPSYLEILSDCNCVVQVSLIAPIFDKLEPGAPTFNERIEIIKKVAPKVKRLNIRIQPYVLEAKKYILETLPIYKDIGVYGITIEGMKYKSMLPGLIKVAGDYCYRTDALYRDFIEIRNKAHDLGLKFYSGENRLRNLSDNLCCCGVDGLGWKVNTYNLNHFIYDKDNFKPTEIMNRIGTADCFSASCQSTKMIKGLANMSLVDVMHACTKDKTKIDQLLNK